MHSHRIAASAGASINGDVIQGRGLLANEDFLLTKAMVHERNTAASHQKQILTRQDVAALEFNASRFVLRPVNAFDGASVMFNI